MVALWEALLEAPGAAAATSQAGDDVGLNDHIVKEELNRREEGAVWRGVIQIWRTGKLRLLLKYREVGGARKGRALPEGFGVLGRRKQQGLAPGRCSL